MGTHDAAGISAGGLNPLRAGLPRREKRVLHIFSCVASVFVEQGYFKWKAFVLSFKKSDFC